MKSKLKEIEPSNEDFYDWKKEINEENRQKRFCDSLILLGIKRDLSGN